jgi:hypothetical protein
MEAKAGARAHHDAGSQPSSAVPSSLETPLGAAFSAAIAAAKDKAAGNIWPPTSDISGALCQVRQACGSRCRTIISISCRRG